MRAYRVIMTLIAAAGLLSGPVPLAGHAQGPCDIVEGKGIGGVQLGMSVQAALAVTGAPQRQQTAGTTVTYTFAAPWAEMVSDYGFVQRVSTRGTTCRTTRGVGPGATLAQVRDAYASATASRLSQTQDTAVLSYPLAGISFRLRGNQVDTVEVFRVEGASAARPAPAGAPSPGTQAPAAAPTSTTAAGGWSVRAPSARVDGADLIVAGSTENRGRAQSAYADVRLFGTSGQAAGRGDAPLTPAVVPSGGTASFETRISIDQVIRRFTVTIRPVGSSSVALAEASGEIRNVQQFAAVAQRLLTVAVQSSDPNPAPNTFVAIVSNGSALPVDSVTVTVDLSVTCRVASSPRPVLVAGPPPPTPAPTPPPTPPPTPRPTPGRTIQESWSGTATVNQVGPRSSGQGRVQLSGGVCLVFTSWTANARITGVKIAE